MMKLRKGYSNLRRSRSGGVKAVISLIVIALFVVLGIYVGLILMFINPIMGAAKAFDEGYLTAMIIAKTIIMCVLASPVGWIIVSIGVAIAKIID